MTRRVEATDRAVIQHLRKQELGYETFARQTEKKLLTVKYTIEQAVKEG